MSSPRPSPSAPETVSLHRRAPRASLTAAIPTRSRRPDDYPVDPQRDHRHHELDEPDEASGRGDRVQAVHLAVQHDRHRRGEPAAVRHRCVAPCSPAASQSLTHPRVHKIVEYSSAAVFEVWQPSAGGEPVVRFVFKNGTNDEFRAYPFLNSSAPVPVSSVVSALTPIGFADLPTWCTKCANTQDRGCGALAAAANQSKTVTVFVGSHDKVSPVGAGFIGAAVMLVVLLGSLALLSFAGVLSFGKRTSSRRLGSDVCDLSF